MLEQINSGILLSNFLNFFRFSVYSIYDTSFVCTSLSSIIQRFIDFICLQQCGNYHRCKELLKVLILVFGMETEKQVPNWFMVQFYVEIADHFLLLHCQIPFPSNTESDLISLLKFVSFYFGKRHTNSCEAISKRLNLHLLCYQRHLACFMILIQCHYSIIFIFLFKELQPTAVLAKEPKDLLIHLISALI